MMIHRTICFTFIALALSGCERNPTELRLVTPASPLDQGIAKDFVDLLDRESTVTIRFAGDPMSEADAVEALIAGDADIALVANGMPFRRRVSTVMPMYPSVLHIGYRAGRDTTDGLSLMKGARIYAGPPGSASRLMFEAVKAHLKLSAEDFTYVDRRMGEGGMVEFPDVVVVFAPVGAGTLDIIPPEVRRNIRFHSMGAPSDVGQGGLVDTAALLRPHLEPFVIPVNTYGDLPTEPVLTLAVDMLLVARADLDTAVVYDLIHEVMRLKPALAALRPGLFTRLTDDIDAANSTFVLHRGLLAYEQRDVPNIYERYSGIAEVLITLILTMVSAAFAGTRMYKLRRKNRIDAFYAKVMEIRQATVDTGTTGQRTAAAVELRGLQATAFEQLIDEKLAADESFRIFISLSNDVLQELREKPTGS